MRKTLQLFVMMVCGVGLLAACANESGPVPTVEDYLHARVAGEADQLRELACGEWEAEAALQAETFASLDAELEDLMCTAGDKQDDVTPVTCEGLIRITYTGEEREQPVLVTFRTVQEDGEWRVCGEAN